MHVSVLKTHLIFSFVNRLIELIFIYGPQYCININFAVPNIDNSTIYTILIVYMNNIYTIPVFSL